MTKEDSCSALVNGQIKQGQNGEVYLMIGEQTLLLNADPLKSTGMVLAIIQNGPDLSTQTFEDLEKSIEFAKTQCNLSEDNIRKTAITYALQGLDPSKLSKQFFRSDDLMIFLSNPKIQTFFVKYSDTDLIIELSELELSKDDEDFKKKVEAFFSKYEELFSFTNDGLYVFYELANLLYKNDIQNSNRPIIPIELLVEQKVRKENKKKQELFSLFLLIICIIIIIILIVLFSLK